MFTIDRDALIDAAYQAGLDEEAIRADYSGRGMYGNTCLGIVADIGELMEVIAILREEAAEGTDFSWVRSARQDSMGLSTITYFPNVKVSP